MSVVHNRKTPQECFLFHSKTEIKSKTYLRNMWLDLGLRSFKLKVLKCSHQTKVEMAMVKAKKATTKEAHEVKMLAKLAVAVELGSTKKLPKMPKSEKEKTFGPP
jgi:hypothetical protein